MISYIERTYFNDLLNRGGYVLDFSTYRFGVSINQWTHKMRHVKLLYKKGCVANGA